MDDRGFDDSDDSACDDVSNDMSLRNPDDTDISDSDDGDISIDDAATTDDQTAAPKLDTSDLSDADEGDLLIDDLNAEADDPDATEVEAMSDASSAYKDRAKETSPEADEDLDVEVIPIAEEPVADDQQIERDSLIDDGDEVLDEELDLDDDLLIDEAIEDGRDEKVGVIAETELDLDDDLLIDEAIEDGRDEKVSVIAETELDLDDDLLIDEVPIAGTKASADGQPETHEVLVADDTISVVDADLVSDGEQTMAAATPLDDQLLIDEEGPTTLEAAAEDHQSPEIISDISHELLADQATDVPANIADRTSGTASPEAVSLMDVPTSSLAIDDGGHSEGEFGARYYSADQPEATSESILIDPLGDAAGNDETPLAYQLDHQESDQRLVLEEPHSEAGAVDGPIQLAAATNGISGLESSDVADQQLSDDIIRAGDRGTAAEVTEQTSALEVSRSTNDVQPGSEEITNGMELATSAEQDPKVDWVKDRQASLDHVAPLVLSEETLEQLRTNTVDDLRVLEYGADSYHIIGDILEHQAQRLALFEKDDQFNAHFQGDLGEEVSRRQYSGFTDVAMLNDPNKLHDNHPGFDIAFSDVHNVEVRGDAKVSLTARASDYYMRKLDTLAAQEADSEVQPSHARLFVPHDQIPALYQAIDARFPGQQPNEAGAFRVPHPEAERRKQMVAESGMASYQYRAIMERCSTGNRVDAAKLNQLIKDIRVTEQLLRERIDKPGFTPDGA